MEVIKEVHLIIQSRGPLISVQNLTDQLDSLELQSGEKCKKKSAIFGIP